jgi:hypothetical protein
VANTQSAKGNPASKRMGNAALKGRRAMCWARGKRRKAARVEAQEKRAAENRLRRDRGELTPWEVARAERAERRRGLQRAA